jgi:hypothetical protein
MSQTKYVHEAVSNVKNYVQEKELGQPWQKKAPTPFAKDYRPEIDIFARVGPMMEHTSSPKLECFNGWWSSDKLTSLQKCRC